MYSYFIKRVRSEELGSQESRNGTTKRGRFLFVSKKPWSVGMFPGLSQTTLNDYKLIALRPINNLDESIYCRYGYHNSKHAELEEKKNRNEFRIYLTKDIDGGQLFQDDLIVMRKTSNAPDCQEYYFGMYTPDMPEYKLIDEAMHASSDQYVHRGSLNYAHFQGVIDCFEKNIPAHQVTEEETKTIVPTPVIEQISEDGQKMGWGALANRFGQQAFRAFVMAIYQDTCAVTGTVLKWKGLNNLEAAHIRARESGGSYAPNNGIAMRRDIHWAFDNGFFTLDDELKIQIHPQILAKGSYIDEYNGQKLKIGNPIILPDKECVEYHRQNVYGKFCRKQGVR